MGCGGSKPRKSHDEKYQKEAAFKLALDVRKEWAAWKAAPASDDVVASLAATFVELAGKPSKEEEAKLMFDDARDFINDHMGDQNLSTGVTAQEYCYFVAFAEYCQTAQEYCLTEAQFQGLARYFMTRVSRRTDVTKETAARAWIEALRAQSLQMGALDHSGDPLSNIRSDIMIGANIFAGNSQPPIIISEGTSDTVTVAAIRTFATIALVKFVAEVLAAEATLMESQLEEVNRAKLTDEDFRGEVEKIFLATDKQKKGALTRQEFKSVTSELKSLVSPDGEDVWMYDALLLAFDQDGDEMLSKEEFSNVLRYAEMRSTRKTVMTDLFMQFQAERFAWEAAKEEIPLTKTLAEPTDEMRFCIGGDMFRRERAHRELWMSLNDWHKVELLEAIEEGKSYRWTNDCFDLVTECDKADDCLALFRGLYPGKELKDNLIQPGTTSELFNENAVYKERGFLGFLDTLTKGRLDQEQAYHKAVARIAADEAVTKNTAMTLCDIIAKEMSSWEASLTAEDKERLNSDTFRTKCDAKFVELDTDGNGTLSFKEAHKGIVEVDGDSKGMKEMELAYLLAFDQTHDEQLSKEEFANMTRYFEMRKTHSSEVTNEKVGHIWVANVKKSEDYIKTHKQYSNITILIEEQASYTRAVGEAIIVEAKRLEKELSSEDRLRINGEEFSKKCEEIFEKYDSNHDGELTRKELHNMMTEEGVADGLIDKELDAVSLDTANLQLLAGQLVRERQEGRDNRDTAFDTEDILFRAFDTSRNQVLEKDEFLNVMKYGAMRKLAKRSLISQGLWRKLIFLQTSWEVGKTGLEESLKYISKSNEEGRNGAIATHGALMFRREFDSNFLWEFGKGKDECTEVTEANYPGKQPEDMLLVAEGSTDKVLEGLACTPEQIAKVKEQGKMCSIAVTMHIQNEIKKQQEAAMVKSLAKSLAIKKARDVLFAVLFR